MKYKIYIFLLIMMSALACNKNNNKKDKPVAKKGVINISNWRFRKDGNIPLSGEWEFYWKKLIPPDQFDSINANNVKYFNIPQFWNGSQLDNTKLTSMGYATYRLTIISDSDKKLSLYVHEQMTAYKLWCNKKEIIVAGKVATKKENAEPCRIPVIVNLNILKGKNELVFQLSNFNHRLGGSNMPPTIGNTEYLYEKRDLKRAYEIFLIGSFIVIGLYFILLYLIKTFIPGTLFIGSFSVLLALRTALTGTKFITAILPNLSWNFQYRLEYITVYAIPILVFYFLHSLYKEEINKKVARVYLFFNTAMLLTLFLPPLFFTKLLFISYAMFIPIQIYLFYGIAVAIIRKRPGAVTIAVSSLIYFVALLNDILFLMGYVNWSTELVPLGTFILVMGQVMALTKIFAGLLRNNEVLAQTLDYRNKNLDSIVKSKTHELRMQQKSILEKNEELQIQNEEIKSISTNLESQKQQLVHSETKMKSLVQLLPEAIFEIDGEGNVIYANDEFYKYIKYDKNCRLNINQLVNTQNSEQKTFLSTVKQKIQERGIVKNLSLDITRSDKTSFPVLFSVLKYTEDEVVIYRCMFMDITSQVADEEKIISAYREISIKNKDITDSLKYAQTMQQAVMPYEKRFSEIFDDYFVINKPRSIVGGDFYYITQTQNKIIFALSDCTGHGVPGGFMTMLGITLLNELYGSSNEIPSPDVALDNMRSKIIESLNQKNEPHSNKDGMDIILCILDTETLLLDFASANQTLLILREDEITSIKGDSMPVGIYLKMKKFSLKQVQLNKGDMLYAFSDGIIDSFGGEKGRKLYLRGLRSIIENCYTQPMQEQKKYIENQFNKWKGNKKQIDDVLVIGIKV